MPVERKRLKRSSGAPRAPSCRWRGRDRGNRRALGAALLTAFAGVLWPTTGSAQNFAACVAGLKQAAVRSGVSPALAARALGIAAPDEKVLRLSSQQAEFTWAIWDYMAVLVDDERVRDGRAMMQRHASTLAAAEARFGVDRHVIAAVWGIESNYGREQGDYFVPHALATLACVGASRAKYWRSELIGALGLVQRGDLPL